MRYLSTLIFTLILVACSKNEIIKESSNPTKSVSFESQKGESNKDRYIITFKDNNILNNRISEAKTYEQKQKVIGEFSKKILLKHNISEKNLVANLSIILKAALVKLSPAQVEQIKKDECIESINSDYFVEYSSPKSSSFQTINSDIYNSNSKLTACTRPLEGYNFGSYQIPPLYSYGYLFSSTEQYYLKMPWGTAFSHPDLVVFGEHSECWVIGGDINLTHPHIQINQTLSQSYVPGSPLNDRNIIYGTPPSVPYYLQPFTTPMVGLIANTNANVNSTWEQNNSEFFSYPMKDPNLCNMVVFKVLTHLDQSIVYFLQAFENAYANMPRPSWSSGNYASIVLSIGPVIGTSTTNPLEQQIITSITSIINSMANQGVCFVFPAYPDLNLNNYFPYNLTHPNVFTVVGMDPCLSTTYDYTTPSYNSYNYIGNIDVAAPGQMVMAPNRYYEQGFQYGSWYAYEFGASTNYMAAAYVAGRLASWGNGFWPTHPNNWFINNTVLTNGGSTSYPTLVGY